MKIYLTHTFKGTDNKAEIEAMISLVNSTGWESFSFIRDTENYNHDMFPEPKDLMKAAREAINGCDALLFDVTDPAVGKAIEAGIAFEAGKKVIVLMQKGSETRRTALGIADLVIEYDQISDIKAPLQNYLSSIIN